MKVIESSRPGVPIVEPEVFWDARGRFSETLHVESHSEYSST